MRRGETCVFKSTPLAFTASPLFLLLEVLSHFSICDVSYLVSLSDLERSAIFTFFLSYLDYAQFA